MAHDDDKEYAGKGVAGSALGLGIAGTALALLNNNGGLGNLLGTNPRSFAGPGCGGYPPAVGFGAPAPFEMHYVIENERRYGRLESELASLKAIQVKDEQIERLRSQLDQSTVLRYVDDKTCGMIKGQNLINPNQIGDPYMGSRMVIATHPPVVEFNRHFGGYPYGYGGGCNPCGDHERWY